MNKYKKPKFDEGSLGKNPFVSSLVIRVNKIAYKGQYRKDGDDLVPVYSNVETEPYCKVYISPERRQLMNGLTKGGKGLLLWVLYEVDRNKDYLWLNKKRYMEENEINSINTYRSAIDELVRYGWLCKSVVSDVFWINPSLFFGGNRVTKYPSKIEIVNDAELNAF